MGVGNTGCPHCIFCARGVVAVRIGIDLALHGRTLFGQLSWFSGRSQEKGSLVSLVVQQESLESSGGLGELLGVLERPWKEIAGAFSRFL